VRDLLDRGIDPNAGSQSGASALLLALQRHDDLDVAKLLISRGADVNEKDVTGFSMLHWACDFGNVRAAEYLIKLGVAVNGVDREGNTPLHIAAWRGSPELARLLVAEGANPNARTIDGETPLDVARSDANSRMAAELVRLGGVAGGKSEKPGDASRPEEQ
jgi:ankyrin repeat protein